MNRSFIYFVIGSFLEVINVYSVLYVGYETDKGTDYLIGEILFNVVLGMVGIVFIMLGIKELRKQDKDYR